MLFMDREGVHPDQEGPWIIIPLSPTHKDSFMVPYKQLKRDNGLYVTILYDLILSSKPLSLKVRFQYPHYIVKTVSYDLVDAVSPEKFIHKINRDSLKVVEEDEGIRVIKNKRPVPYNINLCK